MNFTAPNILTLFRIALIPVLVVLYLMPMAYTNFLVTVVFVVAGITDLLDGYLARRLNQHSRFGAFLDPVADKLIVAAALILLATDDKVVNEVWIKEVFTLAIMIIVGREIAVSALREWMAELGKRGSVAVNFIGKIKTVGQIVAISFLLYQKPIMGVNITVVGEFLLYIAAVLTLWSMAHYLKAAWRTLMEET